MPEGWQESNIIAVKYIVLCFHSTIQWYSSSLLVNLQAYLNRRAKDKHFYVCKLYLNKAFSINKNHLYRHFMLDHLIRWQLTIQDSEFILLR